MRALSKPTSSPRRAENYPPPLMRFLSSNSAPRNRAKSRLSPMFFYARGKRNMEETTQEPSSPKVTCIGQVRGGRRCRRLIKKPLFCVRIPSKLFRSQRRALKKVFRKWASFFKRGYCKKIDARDDSNQETEEKIENNVELHGKKYENREIKGVFRHDPCSSSYPPENALFLTRCRSAPYRCSSLGGRFLSENHGNLEELEKPMCENPEINQKSDSKWENCERSVEDLKGVCGGGMLLPLVLTKCKSEPARTGERLIQEANIAQVVDNQ